MLAHGGNDLFIQVLDELRDLFFQAFGRIGHRLADSGRGVLDFSIEFAHECSSRSCAETDARFCSARLKYYFVIGVQGQWREVLAIMKTLDSKEVAQRDRN